MIIESLNNSSFVIQLIHSFTKSKPSSISKVSRSEGQIKKRKAFASISLLNKFNRNDNTIGTAPLLAARRGQASPTPSMSHRGNQKLLFWDSLAVWSLKIPLGDRQVDNVEWNLITHVTLSPSPHLPPRPPPSLWCRRGGRAEVSHESSGFRVGF